MLRSLLLLASFLIPALVDAQSQTSWSVGRTNLPGVTLVESIAFGNGRFVLTTGGSGSNPPNVAWSTDGETWNAVRPANLFLPERGTVRFIGGNFYLAAGENLFRSPDGVAWQRIPLGIPAQTFRGITTDGTGLLLGSGSIRDNSLIISSDRVTFRRTAAVPESQLGQVTFGDVGFVGGRYFVKYDVMLANFNLRSFVAATTDGNTWELIPQISGTSYFASGNGRLVAYTGSPQVTTDGRTFTRGNTTDPLISNRGRMGFAGGRYFFIGTLQASLDGLTWAPLAATPTLTTSGAMLDIAYGNGRYVAIGYDAGPTPGTQVEVLARLVASAPPTFSTPPLDQTLLAGDALTLTVAMANNDPAITFQWRRDGQVIPGATTSTYSIARVATTDAGRYTVEARNALGTTLSESALITVSTTPPPPPPEPGRIVNLSVLTEIGIATGDDPSFIVGFVVGGADTIGNKSLLIRAAGPSLATFGVGNPNPDPVLELFRDATTIARNDDWNGAAVLADAGTRVGAFPFTSPTSKDAAIFSDIASGGTTMQITAKNNASGSIIAEVYDATPVASFTPLTPRLVNVSVRKIIRAGAALKAGFVIGGTTSKTILIRVIGPGLAQFGLTDALIDPRLALYRAGATAPFATNDDWSSTAALTDTFREVGAFPLLANSRDAVLLLTLDPGNYVAEAQGAPNTSGSALVEVYEVR